MAPDTVNDNPSAAGLTVLWDEAMTGNLLAQRLYFATLAKASYRESANHLVTVKKRLQLRKGST